MAEPVSDESYLLRFYRGRADNAQRVIGEIWRWDYRRLEMVHDYIQWLFPIPEPSRFNPDAEVLTATDAQAFRTDPDLRARLMRSLDLMLDFYGLVRDGDKIVRGPSFAMRSRTWLEPTNHNYLRLTRILLCLRHTGFEAEARALFACLRDIAAHEGKDLITPRTLDFWRGAMAAPTL